jgi:hypothetical protein
MKKENYDLAALANDYVTQDNLCTAHPIAFVITEIFKEPTVDNEPGDCIMAMSDSDNYEFDSIEEAEEHIKNTYNPDDPDDIDIDDYFSYALWYEKVRRQSTFTPQMFLTKNSIQEHIESNKHHYNKPKTLLIHATWRNYEMELFIRELYKYATAPHDQWNHEALRYYKSINISKE